MEHNAKKRERTIQLSDMVARHARRVAWRAGDRADMLENACFVQYGPCCHTMVKNHVAKKVNDAKAVAKTAMAYYWRCERLHMRALHHKVAAKSYADWREQCAP